MVGSFFTKKSDDFNLSPKQVFGLLIGQAQAKMNWVYTTKEVMDIIGIERDKLNRFEKDLNSSQFIETSSENIQVVKHLSYVTTTHEKVSIEENSNGFLFSSVQSELNNVLEDIGEHNISTEDYTIGQTIGIFVSIPYKRSDDATIGILLEGEVTVLTDTSIHFDGLGYTSEFVGYFQRLFIDIGNGKHIDIDKIGEIFNTQDTDIINHLLGKEYTNIIWLH